jgi:hypothetical protein
MQKGGGHDRTLIANPQSGFRQRRRQSRMKTYKNLYPHIWTYNNLYQAWRRAARRKRKSPSVASFE